MNEHNPGPVTITPDCWLVTSSDLLDVIRDRWAPATGSRRLVALRLQHQVKLVGLDALPQRINELVSCGAGTIRVVTERFEPDLLNLSDKAGCEAGQLRLHVWGESPTAVMQTLSTPENKLLGAWAAHRRFPAGVTLAASGSGAAIDPAEYLAAVQEWADEAREAFDDEFSAIYDPLPEPHRNERVVALFTAARATGRWLSTLFTLRNPGQAPWIGNAGLAFREAVEVAAARSEDHAGPRTGAMTATSVDGNVGLLLRQVGSSHLDIELRVVGAAADAPLLRRLALHFPVLVPGSALYLPQNDARLTWTQDTGASGDWALWRGTVECPPALLAALASLSSATEITLAETWPEG